MKLEEFRKNFPQFSNFIGAWFPDADFEKLSDEEVVRKFLEDNCKNQKEVLLEGNRLLNVISEYWQELGYDANRHFNNSEQARKWLNEVLNGLK